MGLSSTVLVAALLFTPTVAVAQTIHPNLVAFNPSPDHDRFTPGGQPLVVRYELHIFRVGASDPLLVINLGKPSPGDNGVIQVAVEDALNISALPTTALEARIATIGGDAPVYSAQSNVFFVDACRYLTPGAIEAPADGGRVEAVVSAADTCGWQVGATGFVTAADSSGAGSARLRLDAAPNASAVARVGGVSVGPQLILVFQSVQP